MMTIGKLVSFMVVQDVLHNHSPARSQRPSPNHALLSAFKFFNVCQISDADFCSSFFLIRLIDPFHDPK